MEYIDSKYFSYADPDDPYLKRLIIRTIESLSGQPELYKLYNEYQRSPELYKNFWEGSVKKLNLNVNFSEEALKQIPKEGPLVVVANHPFGVLDGFHHHESTIPAHLHNTITVKDHLHNCILP